MTQASARQHRWRYPLITGMVALFLSSGVAAETRHQSHESLIQEAHDFLNTQIDRQQYSKVEISMGRLDPRLRLSQCDTPLQTELAPGSKLNSKATVHVRCQGSKPWTVFINANIQLYQSVLVSARPMERGWIIRNTDLKLVERDLSRLNSGYFTEKDRNLLVGKELTRRIPQQRLIKSQYIKPARLVKRGEVVSIVSENTGFSVKMNGKALMDGAKGERIRVRNLSSQRVIEGIVQGSGLVSIN